MNFKTILMPKVILAKLLSQKSYSSLTFLTYVRFCKSLSQSSVEVVRKANKMTHSKFQLSPKLLLKLLALARASAAWPSRRQSDAKPRSSTLRIFSPTMTPTIISIICVKMRQLSLLFKHFFPSDFPLWLDSGTIPNAYRHHTANRWCFRKGL